MNHSLISFLPLWQNSSLWETLYSFKNELCLLVDFRDDQTCFHKKVFTQELILKQRHKATGKGPICKKLTNKIVRYLGFHLEQRCT